MEEPTLEQMIRSYLNRDHHEVTEASHQTRHTPAQFSRWIRRVNRLSSMIIELSDLLGLTEEEQSKLFALARPTTKFSPHQEAQLLRSQPKNGGGRPRDEDNEWAFEQVHILHRPRCDVYKEWLARRQKHGKNVQLADPYDSFKKAVSIKGKKRRNGD